jgi:hypothetical protein
MPDNDMKSLPAPDLSTSSDALEIAPSNLAIENPNLHKSNFKKYVGIAIIIIVILTLFFIFRNKAKKLFQKKIVTDKKEFDENIQKEMK